MCPLHAYAAFLNSGFRHAAYNGEKLFEQCLFAKATSDNSSLYNSSLRHCTLEAPHVQLVLPVLGNIWSKNAS